jgi:crotonobetainyl-CoA:carnitine CoA-transferase CaiB-like acyl-CoA transferase
MVITTSRASRKEPTSRNCSWRDRSFTTNSTQTPQPPVYDYAELFADAQVKHNGIVAEQHHPVAGPIKVIGIPVKLSETPGDVGAAAPLLGEHTRDILQELGYDDTAIDRLCRDEVVEAFKG